MFIILSGKINLSINKIKPSILLSPSWKIAYLKKNQVGTDIDKYASRF